MTDLKSISGIDKAALELLEVAGFPDAESLAKAGVNQLVTELERANTILQIAKRPPTHDNVTKWIAAAQDLVGIPHDVKCDAEMPVNYETTPKVASMLATAPFAIPLPAKILVEQGLAVGDIPPAILLNRYLGDLEVKLEDRVPGVKSGRPTPSPGTNVHLADVSGTRREINVSRIQSTDVLAGPVVKSAIVKAKTDDDRVALIRGPRVETNQGRDPKSRFFIRGVMHSHPISMAVGAVVTLVLAVMLPLGIVSSLLLLLSRELPEKFDWVPEWILALPLSLPILGLMYLIWGLHGSCRICGQKLFVPRMCLKNSKAHHVPGLGYIIPVCFHMLVFKWFRCTYCGTPVRLKK